MPEAWRTRLSTQGNTPRRPAGLAALIFCPSGRKGELSLLADDTVLCRRCLSIVTRSPQTCPTTLLTCSAKHSLFRQHGSLLFSCAYGPSSPSAPSPRSFDSPTLPLEPFTPSRVALLRLLPPSAGHDAARYGAVP